MSQSGSFCNCIQNYEHKSKRKKRKINQLEKNQELEETDNGYAFAVNNYLDNVDGFIDVEIGGVPCNFLIDSGSTYNVVDKAYWEELKKEHIKPKTDRQLKNGIDPKVNPVAQEVRKIPYGRQSKVEEKLDELEGRRPS